jgi:NADPH-dependent ferric siderophore reductase
VSAQGIGLRSEPPRGSPRRLRVVQLIRLGPRLRRVVLGGDLTHFPERAGGSHLKLFFRRPGQERLRLPEFVPGRGVVWPEPAERPIARTYSVAAFDAQAGTLSIDFALHGDEGPATRWASHARIGDELGVAGPGGPNPMLGPAQRYLLVGDLTALPAIMALAALMPADTVGEVAIEATAPDDVLPFAHPEGVRVRWSYRPPHAPSGLLAHVRDLSFSAADTFAFLAGENGPVVAIRDHLLGERGFAKRQLYAVPYWRERQTEEEYHQERHRIMDELLDGSPAGAAP